MKYGFLLLPVAALLGYAASAQTLPDGQPRPVKPFSVIRVSNGIALTLTAGHEQHVEVSAASAEFRERIRTTVSDGTLLISYDDGDERDNRKTQRTDHRLQVAVTADYLTMLVVGSGAKVQAQGNVAAPDCVLDINSGGSLAAAGLSPRVLVVRLSTGGTATLAGRAPRLDVRASGQSTLDAQRLQATRGQVEAVGNSAVRVNVSEALLAEAGGKSEIRYSGSPTLTQEISADSKLKNDK